MIGALCNNASPKFNGEKNSLSGDSIEIALVQLSNTSGTTADEIKRRFIRIAEVPFSSETKIMGTMHKNGNETFVAAKGSVEHLLTKCNRIQNGTSVEALKEDGRKKILDASEKLAANGLRVLAFAYNDSTSIIKDYLFGCFDMLV